MVSQIVNWYGVISFYKDTYLNNRRPFLNKVIID